jgi:hypothetical protein
MYLSRIEGEAKEKERTVGEQLALAVLSGAEKMLLDEFRAQFYERYKGTQETKRQALSRLLRKSHCVTLRDNYVVTVTDAERVTVADCDTVKNSWCHGDTPVNTGVSG